MSTGSRGTGRWGNGSGARSPVEYREPSTEGRPIRRLLLPAVLFVGFSACTGPPGPVPSPSEPVGLPNLHALGDGLWSGGTPDGDDGFRSLRDLGVKTVISVDGIRPDVKRARQFGLRYVHIPVGYGGIPRERAVQLVRAAGELPGPIYVHCHHGQHRGPAAAAIMRLCRPDGWPADEAVAFLRTAGTDPRYEGLYASVRDFVPPSDTDLHRVSSDFPEVADVPDLTARMVEIDDLWDTLKRARANGWHSSTPPDSVAHLALRLNEQFREVARLRDTAPPTEGFTWFRDNAERASADLEAALRAGDTTAAGKAYVRTAATCTACHHDYRDRKRP
jgi:protein tyrosine phosphatase (PTP) superfamily phosphohydrolase (DUF442 family)